MIIKDFNEIFRVKFKVVLYFFFIEEIWGLLRDEIRFLKEWGVLLVVGGYYVIVMLKYMLNVFGFDIVVIGEGEEVFY